MSSINWTSWVSLMVTNSVLQDGVDRGLGVFAFFELLL